MACIVNFSAITQPKPQPCFASLPASTSSHRSNSPKLQTSHLSFASNNSRISLRYDRTLAVSPPRETLLSKAPNFMIVAAANKPEPLKIMISGAPASGKGTQCELITQKYGLVHVAAGDLLRAEVAAGSENGRRAKQFMEKGQLVPDEIVVMMVKERLLRPDAHKNGWLLDGYPRSSSQAIALKEFGFEPDLFILLDVAEDTLVERVVGRRLDPVTGKIYHLKYSPPETEEIAARLTQRFDDTEEKVKLRLRTHHQNVEAVLSMYKDITVKVNGNLSKNDVFAKIDNVLDELLEQRKAGSGYLEANKA
ncbi:adenylate kinase, chloroplastic isoform X2 [Juglans microcarpa x Juglans regia]|uniref:adenylate kinase, chloroplastic isoform X2 n=1 Tax=Juglans microcarpa x Juglans regia TaxID=2249226 RepID=UPI001B7EA29C|nr:adenylate kinase, chloroplastic isoform X2 [Juglans microcarpa x Juglans regia]